MEKERTKGIGKERMAYRLKAGQIWKMERRRGMVRDGSEWYTLYRLEGGQIWKRKEGEEWVGMGLNSIHYAGLKEGKYGKWKGGKDQGGREWYMF